MAAHGKNDAGFGGHFQAALAGALGARRRGCGLADDTGKVGALGVFAAFASRKIEILIQHVLHLGDVLAQRPHVSAVVHHRELQLEPCQRRLQVVADPGKHLGALRDVTFDALAHGDEGLRGAAHFARAIRLEIGNGTALSEALGGNRQALDRPHLIAQKQDSDPQQNQRRTDHPEDKHVHIRGDQPLTRDRQLQHPVLYLHADVHEGAAITRRERPGLSKLPLEHGGHRILEIGVGMPEGAVEMLPGLNGDPVAEIARRHSQQHLALRPRWIFLFEVGEEHDVGRRAASHAGEHHVVMPLEEDVSDDSLENHHRRHDDDERPAEQASRQSALQGAKWM